MSMTEELKKQIKSAEIVIKNQGGEYDDAHVSCNAIDCINCFGSGFGCGLTYTDFKGFMDKHGPEQKPKAKMITREEFAKLMKNKCVVNTSEVEAKIRELDGCLGGIAHGGIDSFFNNNWHLIYFRGANRHLTASTKNAPSSDSDTIITSTEFLSYFNTEEKVEVKAYPEELKFKSRKDFLLARIKQIEAHKKEFNQTIDKQIESLQKEMTCDGCYIQEDGQYKINESRVNSKSAVEVAEFINRMEADFE